jgi:oligopeptide/dipeptide ABC transporter ATP-binding protein
MSEQPVLEVKGLGQSFTLPGGGELQAVRDVSFSLARGETLGIVGESGSGKTTLGRTLLRLYNPTSGSITFEGDDITHTRARDLRSTLRRKASMIFQNPATSLSPTLTVGDILAEPLRAHGVRSSNEQHRRVSEMLELVGIDPDWAERQVSELSGGQRQRVGIARALMLDPSLIVADEPTASLDISVQAQIINLLNDLQIERNLSFIFISHDLSLVRHISDRVAVMYLGEIVEIGTSEQIFNDPQHPYTASLVSMTRAPADRIVPQGDAPSPLKPPRGCHFHPRCPVATVECETTRPVLSLGGDGRSVACIRPGTLTVGAPDELLTLPISHPLAAAL